MSALVLRRWIAISSVAVEGAALPFEVELLAAADASVTRGVRQDLPAAQRALRRKRRGEHRFKGESLQRVARQHGGGLAEHLVVRRLAAAQIVVVHARQIVVNERIGMQQLHAAGGGKRSVNVAAAEDGRIPVSGSAAGACRPR